MIITPSDQDPGGGGQQGPAGWGTVPTTGSVPSSIPPDPSTPSAVQDSQSSDATVLAIAQTSFLPPAPTWTPMLDALGFMTAPWTTWFQTLARRVGGYTSTPLDDAMINAEESTSGDGSVLVLNDLLSQPDLSGALGADLYAQIDALAVIAEQAQLDGWNRQPAQAAAVPAAPAGGLGILGGGWSSAADRDAAITCINNLRDRLATLETACRTVGITF